MTVTPSKLDRGAILRNAWVRARQAAAAAGESVRRHIGAAMRTAWAEAKAAASPAPAEPVVSPRDVLVARIARNDQAMDEIQAGIDRNYAVLGSSGIIEYQYKTLDDLHTHGLNLRDDLKELDAAATAAMATTMVEQPCQQQQANAARSASTVCEACGRALTDPVSIEAGVGPICRAAGHSRRQLGLFDNPSDYRIELAGGVICVTDLDRGGRTVTNDAAGVVEDLRRLGYDLGRMPVIYRDTNGDWDEMVVLNGRFAGFRAIDSDRKQALREIAQGLDVPPPEMIAQPCQQQQAQAGDAAQAAPRAIPDLSTEEGLAEVLAGRTATLQLQGGEAVYRVTEIKRWSSPDGSRVRDYISLTSEGMASDDRKGPASLFVERAGGGRGTYLDTAAGRVWWGYGVFCDSGTKRGRADDLVKELFAPLASSEGSL